MLPHFWNFHWFSDFMRFFIRKISNLLKSSIFLNFTIKYEPGIFLINFKDFQSNPTDTTSSDSEWKHGFLQNKIKSSSSIFRILLSINKVSEYTFFGLFLSLGFINIHPKYHEKLKFAVLNIFLRMFKIFIWLNIAFKGSPLDKDLLLLQNPNLMTLKLIHLNLYLNFKKMICVGFSS